MYYRGHMHHVFIHMCTHMYDTHVQLLYTHSTQYTPHETQYIPHEIQYTPHETQYTPHETQYIPHETQYTPHETQYTPHETPAVLFLQLVQTVLEWRDSSGGEGQHQRWRHWWLLSLAVSLVCQLTTDSAGPTRLKETINHCFTSPRSVTLTSPPGWTS